MIVHAHFTSILCNLFVIVVLSLLHQSFIKKEKKVCYIKDGPLFCIC